MTINPPDYLREATNLRTAHEDAVHARARADAARLRAAAAIVAVRGNDGIADWLDELAAKITPPRTHQEDQP